MRTSRWVALAAAMVLTTWCTLRKVDSHAPVQRGTAEEFWLAALNVQLPGLAADAKDRLLGIYPPRESWAIYYVVGYHDEYLKRVPFDEAAGLLPEVAEALADRDGRSEMTPWQRATADRWVRRDDDESEARRLLDILRDARLEDYAAEGEGLDAYQFASEAEFVERWERAKSYWVTVLFEACWLNAVVVFGGWPLVRGAGRVGCATHLGLTLPLLFLPHFFGYVPLTFTSAFPAGGIGYPYFLRPFRGLPLTSFDIWFLENAPQPFEVFMQHPGPMISLSAMRAVGPVAVMCLGVVISLAVLVASSGWAYLRRWLSRSAR